VAGQFGNAGGAMAVGKTITLKGKSLKGKNRVREKGELWRVLAISPGTEYIQRGMWFIESANKGPDNKPLDWRWIHPTADNDFEVVSISDV